jgi:glycosyltransferase involved in cell wall biosynthesis
MVLADALNATLNTPEIRKLWAEEGRRRWEREFTVDRICEQYLEFLRDLDDSPYGVAT